MTARLAAMLAAGMLVLPGAAAAEPLGRLFFTSEQRAALDRQRRNDASQHDMEGMAMRLDGIVTRSGGKATVWINGRPRYANDASGGDVPAALRVGESIDLVTQQKTDVVAPGAVQVDHAQTNTRR